MPHWLLKSAIQHAIYRLPRRQAWNRLFQKYVTRSVDLTPEKFEVKVRECHRHWTNFREARGSSANITAFELGTGWFPIIPVGLFLCGARQVWTVDIDPMLRPEAMRQMLHFFCQYADSGKLRELLPGLNEERLKTVRPLVDLCARENAESLLKRMQIDFLVLDAQSTPVPPKTVDLYLSSGVLEYIPRPVLQGIFKEARRILVPAGIMSHRLNLIDQFSYFDRSITAFNFLQYTQKQWRWRNSPLTWQSRLRVPDFRQLFAEGGFEIIREDNQSGQPADLERITLAPEFRHYRKEDLLVLHSFLVARLKQENS